MMRIKSLTYYLNWHTMLTLCVVLCLCSCAKDEFDAIVPQVDSGLILTPQVFDAVATRAPSDLYEDTSGWQEGDEKPGDDALLENDLGTKLDVFISGIDDGFWKEFHLTKGQNFSGLTANVQNNVADLLSDAWKTLDGNGYRLTVGHRYDVYVAVNTPTTNGTIGNKAALLALVNHNDIVYKLYGSQNNAEYDPSRRMMMDGHVVWTLENENQIQRINVPLKRAEAKIAVSIKFDPAFYASLKDNYFVDSPIGPPAWKWVHWCFDSKVFADGPDITPNLETNEDRNLATATGVLNHQKYYHYQDNNVNVYFTEDEKDPDGNLYLTLYPSAEEKYVDGVPTCNIITYDYCSNWGDNAEEEAPFLLLSYGFSSKESQESETVNTTYNYYRIPVCDESAHSELERNHIYKVDAVISGSGSTSLDGRVNPVRLYYQVVDWTHNANEVVNVKAEKFYFFYVTPKRYELRGEGTQSVNLDYYAPANSTVQIKDLDVYYYNSSGTKRTSTASVTVDATNEQIVVSSEVLANRAVKYISFTAYTTYVDDEGVSHTLEEQVFVKHYPTDNIQNIEGSWSSKWGGTTTVTQRQYSFNPTEDGWDSWDGYENNIECTKEVYDNAVVEYRNSSRLTDGTPSDHDASNYYYNYSTGTDGSTTQSNYRNNITQGVNRYNTNGENNASLGNDGYWYWGSTRIEGTRNNYDWRGETAGGSGTRYRWTNYYRTQYYKTHYYARRYYRDVEVTIPSTGNWVDWENDQSNHSTQKTTYDGSNFYAKVYYNGAMYRINENQGGSYWNGYYYYATRGQNAGTNLTNNHMYVIQMSNTSSDYVFGKPILDANYQSQDDVVYPALMMASQLGAVTPFGTARNAAIHCGTYMEVDVNGKRFTGWRLPTDAEIKVIYKYQYDNNTSEIITEVLGGENYYNLSGGSSKNWHEDPNGTNNNNYVRCVREMSDEDIRYMQGEMTDAERTEYLSR